jgi:hypothetical protein
MRRGIQRTSSMTLRMQLHLFRCVLLRCLQPITQPELHMFLSGCASDQLHSFILASRGDSSQSHRIAAADPSVPMERHSQHAPTIYFRLRKFVVRFHSVRHDVVRARLAKAWEHTRSKADSTLQNSRLTVRFRGVLYWVTGNQFRHEPAPA